MKAKFDLCPIQCQNSKGLSRLSLRFNQKKKKKSLLGIPKTKI